MKTLLIILGLVVFSAVSYACAGCGCSASAKKDAEDNVKYIEKAELQKLIKANDNLVIVDVLRPDSYIKNHIKGAINIPLAKLYDQKYIDLLKKYKTVVVYCANKRCKASTKAAKLLMKHGLKNVLDYENGIAEWKESNLPLGSGKKCKCGAAKGSPVCCK